MPRPTAAQLVYGFCTVLFSTLAMLLLSHASSVPGIAVIAVAALALGLFVALTAPAPRATRSPRPTEPVRAASRPTAVTSARASSGAVREPAKP